MSETPNPKLQAALRALDVDPGFVVREEITREGYLAFAKHDDGSRNYAAPSVYRAWVDNKVARKNPELLQALFSAHEEEVGPVDANAVERRLSVLEKDVHFTRTSVEKYVMDTGDSARRENGRLDRARRDHERRIDILERKLEEQRTLQKILWIVAWGSLAVGAAGVMLGVS